MATLLWHTDQRGKEQELELKPILLLFIFCSQILPLDLNKNKYLLFSKYSLLSFRPLPSHFR